MASFLREILRASAYSSHHLLGGCAVHRLSIFLVASVSLLAIGSGVAIAESQTVNGTGDITKMVASNGTSSVTTKVFGLKRPCGGAQYLHVHITKGDGTLLYEAEGTCISAEWYTSLWYTPTGMIEDAEAVDCPAFTFTRNRTTGAYKVVMPRSCLANAPNRIKVDADGHNYGTLTGGLAGPTKLLSRG
jgi:hypothetical protein